MKYFGDILVVKSSQNVNCLFPFMETFLVFLKIVAEIFGSVVVVSLSLCGQN